MERRPPPQGPQAPPLKTKEPKTPTLVRVFVSRGSHHNSGGFAADSLPRDEERLQVWPRTTLRELADLLCEARPEIRRPRVQLSFAIVYPDKLGRQTVKHVGRLFSQQLKAQAGEARTLQSLRFEAGDYLDVAVLGLDDDQRGGAAKRHRGAASSSDNGREQNDDGRRQRHRRTAMTAES